MIKAIQKRAEALGEGGCYFFSLCYLAERISGYDTDPLDALDLAIKSRFAQANCYLDYPDRILSMLTHKEWTVTHEGKDYQPKNGECEVLRYEWKRPGTTLSHFVVGDGNGGIEYDPLHSLGLSPVIQNGHLVSKRIFRRKE